MHISTPFELVGTQFIDPARCRTSLTLRFMSTKGWNDWLSGEDFLSNMPRVGLPPLVAGGPPGTGAGGGGTTGAMVAGRGMASAGGGAPK